MVPLSARETDRSTQPTGSDQRCGATVGFGVDGWFVAFLFFLLCAQSSLVFLCCCCDNAKENGFIAALHCKSCLTTECAHYIYCTYHIVSGWPTQIPPFINKLSIYYPRAAFPPSD